jgi:hypothetical protein
MVLAVCNRPAHLEIHTWISQPSSECMPVRTVEAESELADEYWPIFKPLLTSHPWPRMQ